MKFEKEGYRMISNIYIYNKEILDSIKDIFDGICSIQRNNKGTRGICSVLWWHLLSSKKQQRYYRIHYKEEEPQNKQESFVSVEELFIYLLEFPLQQILMKFESELSR